MNRAATREASRLPDLWQYVPLECYVCALAIFVAAGLKLGGVLP